MHKLKQLSASSFLRLLFAAFTFAFLCSAFIAPDRAEMFTGLRRIMTESSKVSTNYFDNGGYAGTFLNAGLVCLVLTALYSLPKVKVNATSCLAFLLTAGFCFWGVNILNLWFGFLGVLLYCLVKRENPANQINAMVFTTGICPLFTDLMIRYPHADVVGFRWQGILLAVAIGLFIGFCLPAGLVHSPKMHKGYDLYSAAVPVGLTAFFVRALLYQALGGTLPGGASTDLGVSSWNVANVFCFGVFGLCIVGALVLGCRPKDYPALLDGAPGAKIAAWWDRAVDVIPAGGGKGIGIEKMLAYYGLDKGEALAFGDGNNDREMLQAVGTGVAMENGSPELKAIADEICGPVYEDGIYHYCADKGLI